MDQQKESFVTITALPNSMDIFIYKMYHSFVSAAGVARILFSVIFIAIGIATIGEVSYLLTVLVLALGILNPVVTPIMFFAQSLNSANNLTAICYSFSDRGIVVSNGKDRSLLKWDELALVVLIRRELLIYTSPSQALVVPRRQMGKDEETILSVIRRSANSDRCVFRRFF